MTEPIEYIGSAPPEFELPRYAGKRYEAKVPDTLDLQERATLAVHGLTSPTNPSADHEIYWLVFFGHNPPMMQHDWSDAVQGKFVEALPLVRTASGSDLNLTVERTWLEAVLRQQGPDGLLYYPIHGRPWWRVLEYGPKPPGDHYAVLYYNGRMLNALTIYYRLTGESIWRDAAARLTEGLRAILVDEGDFAYFPWIEFGVGGSLPEGAAPGQQKGCHLAAWFQTIHGLARYGEAAGDERAIGMSRKIARWVTDQSDYFADDGRYLPEFSHSPKVHFHAHTMNLHALMECAMVTDDPELMEFVRRGYEYGTTQGEALTGYFPELLGSEQLEHSELCEVADMIAVGLKLTQAGVGDYLDDVDRWVRNMFAEGQLTPDKVGWLQRYSANLPTSTLDPSYQTTERVVERNVGAYAGWPKMNDWYVGEGPGIMHCCTGNSGRALFMAWDGILTHDSDRLKVNLLLNRASPWADVQSHIPYTGRVHVRIKQQTDLWVRIPEWVEPSQVRVRVNDAERRADWNDRYAIVGQVKPADLVTMTFPISERTDTVWVEKERFTLVRKGNDVVAIDPPGRHAPLYQREHYRDNETRWRKANRFIPDDVVHW